MDGKFRTSTTQPGLSKMKPGSSMIKWGTYLNKEGPYYLGNSPLPTSFKNPNKHQKILMVLTATESGKADSVNMYDDGICSIGFRQDTAQSGNLQKLLAYINQKVPESTVNFYSFLSERGYDFKPGYNGVYNFFSIHNNEPLTSSSQLAKMFLGVTGSLGSWPGGRNGVQAQRAIEFCRVLAEVLSFKGAPEAQAQFALDTMYGFMAGKSKEVFLDNRGKTNDPAKENILEAGLALYISFAANNPSIANRSFSLFMEKTEHSIFSPEWLKALAAFMTFDPQIAIYPNRFNAIRPVIERLYGVNLPDYYSVLQAEYREYTFKYEEANVSFNLCTVQGMQGALEFLGYDPGPIDGILGRKTTTAIIEFQKDNHLTMDGKYGYNTRARLFSQLKYNSLLNPG